MTSSFPVSMGSVAFLRHLITPIFALPCSCIVHMLRNSFKFVGRKERNEVAAELKKIYTAVTAEAAKLHWFDSVKSMTRAFPPLAKVARLIGRT